MPTFSQSFSPYEIANYGLVRLPKVEVSLAQKAEVGLPVTATNYEFLAALARKGFTSKAGLISKARYKEYGKRASYELEVFEELGFTDYVLLVFQVINKAREMGVFIDYGRGSCAGSVIFWFLGITGVDAVDKGLFFERFVSRVRSKKQVIDGEIYLQGDLIADADLNLGDGRDAIIQWLHDVYPNRVSKILNLSTFTGKILIKDVYKSYEGASEEEAKAVSDMLEKHFGIVEDLADAAENNERFKTWVNEHQKTYQIALKMVDLIRQTSIHASGYLVSFYDLHDTVPLECDEHGGIVSGFDMREVSNFAVKLDLLSLTTNRIIKDVLNVTGLNPNTLNLDSDPVIYDQFQTKNELLPYGLYQISADCAYGVLNEIQPKNVFELSDVNACARPGALSYVKSYVEGTHVCPHPLFEPILKNTRNHCLYQEQMMQLLVAVGFTPDEAETCRKIVGKKLVEKVKEWKEKIYAKIAEKGFDQSLGDVLWKILDDSSKYSFNLAHSLATSYLSALTVYLKYRYPAEFYCACLNSAKDLAKMGETPQDQIAYVNRELSHFGIKLLPPSMTKSKVDFTIEDGNIRFGMKLVKGLSDKNLERWRVFLNDMGDTKFKVFNSIKNAGLNIGVGSALIQAGCLDDFGSSRTRTVLEFNTFSLLTDKEKALCITLADKPEVNHDVLKAIVYLRDNKDEKGKPLFSRATRFGTIKKKYEKYKEIWEMNRRNEKLANYFYERTILGFSYSHSLREIFGEEVDGLMSVADTEAAKTDDKVRLIGFVKDPIKSKSKAGNDMFRFTLTDETGEISIRFFNKTIDQIKEANGRLPEEGDIILTKATKKDGSCCFTNELSIVTAKIYLKLSELKDGAGQGAEISGQSDPK